MNPKVDWYFTKAEKWQQEFMELRMLVLSCGLTEELKWGHPCYTLGKANIVLMHGFKDYCALLFFKGALLKDSAGLLVQQTENVQAARQIRFTGVGEIRKLRAKLKAYIHEAAEAEKSGKKVELKKVTDYPVPEEFQKVLDEDRELKKAFSALTPGRQKGYLFYFNQAKQSKTRKQRIEKNYQRILAGKGIDD